MQLKIFLSFIMLYAYQFICTKQAIAHLFALTKGEKSVVVTACKALRADGTT